MNWLLLCTLLTVLQCCRAPPVAQKAEGTESDVVGLEDYMEYHRYLKEVVNALESDPDFRAKLEKADENEIKSGKIADELQFVSHHVRNRLDELKRIELDRLRQLVEQKMKLENSIDTDDPMHHHIDKTNPHTFEIEDLKKLIAKTTEDLAEADRKRKEQFKQYELEKEYQKQEKLNHTNGTEKEKLEKEYQVIEEMEKKHKNHEKLHEPGHKAQLEEVWEEQDQMQQDFDPKTFFMLHDIDGNGLWDQDEVKALFIKELDKMYQQGAPEDDWRERMEEMERMRESVFREMDKNNDGFIDFHEFYRQTNTNDFKQDHGWQGLDEQKPYTDEELAEYIRQHEAMNYPYQGVPPGGYQQVPPGGYQQVPPGGYQQVPPGGYQQPQGGYQQPPPGGYQQPPPAGYQQPPPAGYQQPPPGGYQQPPPGGYQQGYQQAQPAQNSQGYLQVPHNAPVQQQVPQSGQQAPPAGSQQQVQQTAQHVPLSEQQLQGNHQLGQNQQPQVVNLNTNEVHPPQHQQIPVVQQQNQQIPAVQQQNNEIINNKI